MVWYDEPDRSTPVDAAHLNQYSADLAASAAAAAASAAAAAASAALAVAPTDAAMAAAVSNPASDTAIVLSSTYLTPDSLASDTPARQNLDARFALIGASLTQAPGKNLFDMNAATLGQFWNGVGSTTITLAGYYASVKIPVTVGQTYTINNARNITFFPATGNAVSPYVNNATNAPYTVTIPAGTAFCAFNVLIANVTLSQMETGSAVTSYEPYGVKVQRLLANGRYLDDAVAEAAAAVSSLRRSGGLTVCKTGTDMLVRSAFDTTRDIIMPLALTKAPVLGAAPMVMLTTDAQPFIQLIPYAATDAQVWPTISAAITPTPIHGASDDNCPVHTQSSYVGGNHGYYFADSVTMTAHGKTNADRGSQWSDGTRIFTLLQVVDANHVLMGFPYTVAAGVVTSQSYWGVVAPLTHVSGATNTATITITGGLLLTQLHPCTHSRTVTALIDGRPILDGTTFGQVLTVTETYTIVSYKGLIDWAQANIGGDPFANIATMPAYVRVSNTYRFTPAQVVAAQTVTALEAAILNVGVTQAMPLLLPASGLLEQFMAGVGVVGALDYRTLAPLSTLAADASVVLANQTTAADPAQRILQWACDSGGAPQWGLALGILPVMDGKPATRRANGTDVESWFIAASTKKNYPRLAKAKALAIGASLSGVAYRRYLPPTASPTQVISDGSRSWVTVDRTDATVVPQVALAPQLLGRKINTVGATTLALASSVVTGEGLTYTNTAPGQLLAEAVIDTTV
jgi:hypothetical protein